MSGLKKVLLLVVLVLFGTGAAYLQHLHHHQKLGQPGVKATPIAGGLLMNIPLPEEVLGYTSVVVPPIGDETNSLPKDTTLVKRAYKDPTGTTFLGLSLNVVMMGTDRTSIHKPDYCLPGQGWQIVEQREMKVPMSGSQVYELPVMRWTVKKMHDYGDGKQVEIHGYYMFWYTAENEITGTHPFWRIVKKVLQTGVLPRWSYVSYFCYFYPGQDEHAAEKLMEFVAASAPAFQLPPHDDLAAAKAR